MASVTEVDGHLRLDLAAAEVELLRGLLARVADLLTDDDADLLTDDDADRRTTTGGAARRTPADPVLARLLPDAHREDPEVAAAHRELTESSLRTDKRADAKAVMAALPAGAGTAVIDDIDAWLRAVNDVRLMLGVELDITEETEPPDRVGDERDLQLTVYFWLTYLQDRLVETVLG